MFRRYSWIRAILVLTVAFPWIVGCGARTAGHSTLRTSIGDCEVKATLDGAGSLSSQGEAAVIDFAGGNLVVDKHSVQLNGNEVAKLPEQARKVEVDYTAGKLTIKADGAELFTTDLGK